MMNLMVFFSQLIAIDYCDLFSIFLLNENVVFDHIWKFLIFFDPLSVIVCDLYDHLMSEEKHFFDDLFWLFVMINLRQQTNLRNLNHFHLIFA